MADSLLDVGLGAYEGSGSETDIAEAARELVARALSNCRYKELPIRLAVLLATDDWSHPHQELPRHVCAALSETLHREVPLIGGCMAKILTSAQESGFLDHGMALALFCSFDLWASVDCLEKPYSIGGGETRRAKLKEVAQRLEDSMSPRLGATADRYLVTIFPGITMEADGRHMRDSDFHWDVKAAFSHAYHLYGASSTDTLDPTTGYQFVNDKCYESSLAIALVENDLKIAAAMRHPFDKQRQPRVSVDRLWEDDESGVDIEILDMQPATERLQQLKNEGAVDLVDGIPVFGLFSAGGVRIILPIEPVIGRPGCIRVNRKVAVGDRLLCMRLKDESLLHLCESTMDEAFSVLDVQPEEAGFFMGFVCRALYSHHAAARSPFAGATARIREKYSNSKFMFGLCAAEFASTEQRGPNANHMCLWARCYTGHLSEKAQSRIPIARLSTAVNVILNCGSSADIMQKALEGATQAGAGGGQICLWDRRLKRILGEGFGRAYQPAGSNHKWLEISKMTNRAAPSSLGGSYPADIEDWLIPVTGDINRIPSSAGELNLIPAAATGSEDEDILTMIARTGLAMFVPDSSDPRFHCRQETVGIARFKVQLAIPIYGASGKVLGTFQVSFPDDKRMTREEFAAWIQYVQRVGTMLEVAFIREAQRDQYHLGLFADEFQRDLEGRLDQGNLRGLFQGFCERLKALLGADAVHMRLLNLDAPGDEFTLSGYSGPLLLEELYPRLRETTSAGKGGACSRRVLESGGVMSSSRAEADALRYRLAAIKHKELEAALLRELSNFHATATLPLIYGDMLLGSLIIDSNFEFFFSERIDKLARQCAQVAADLVREWEGFCLGNAAQVEAENAQQDRDGQKPGLAPAREELPHVVKLRSLLKAARNYLHADWASLFAWHEESQDLVLLVSDGWDRPLEGRACYEPGEGFTGRVAADTAPYQFERGPIGVSSLKYDEYIAPLDQRSVRGDYLPRIGFKLMEGQSLAGVLTFGYNRVHADRAALFDERSTNALTSVGRVMSGWITSLRAECLKSRRRRLDQCKDELASGLLTGSSKGNWQGLLDGVRLAFEVERLALYLVEAKSVTLGWHSPWLPELTVTAFEASEFPSFAALIQGDDLVVGELSDQGSPNNWPKREGIRAFYAVRVTDPESTARGVLEFANRAESFDHPFTYLDSIEREAANDVARLLGAALASSDHRLAIERLRGEVSTATRIGATNLFGAIVMHDLMGPFKRIQRAVDRIRLFRQRPPDSALSEIEGELKASSSLIERARHQDGGKTSVEQVHWVVREALRAIDATIPPNGVTVTVKNDLQVGVRVSRYSMVAGLVNILRNALEEIGDSGVLKVSTALADNRRVLIQVYNTGHSLPLEMIEKILRSTITTKAQEGHLGLGIQLARQAIEGAGGNLSIESPPEGGVLVTASLPIAASPATKTGSETSGDSNAEA